MFKLQVLIGEDMLEDMDAICKMLGQTRSSFCRRAIQEAMTEIMFDGRWEKYREMLDGEKGVRIG